VTQDSVTKTHFCNVNLSELILFESKYILYQCHCMVNGTSDKVLALVAAAMEPDNQRYQTPLGEVYDNDDGETAILTLKRNIR